MSITPSEYDFVVKLFKQESAISLEAGKEYLVELRLGILAEAEGFASYHALIHDLVQNPDSPLLERMVDAMTTNETLFFRDFKHYEFLQKELLPRLLSAVETNRELNIWSAACSTGQEPYSIAMLIHQNFPHLCHSWKTHFLATDLSDSCLDYARRGIYNQFEVNRGLPVSYLVRYFMQHNRDWLLKDEIKSMFSFQKLNLIKTWPELPQMDVVFLRNVLIYFDMDVKRQIIARVRQKIKKNGYLFLGSAETLINIDSSFKRVDSELNVNCYQLV